ncbi:hypothetical protein SAMN02745126_04007 [Enhydrobacter aerosaccus]|uniref:Uncharacterized protein n=1 Tax=Enhydrobacter aerosaccus TaxID=225324 RepID=A0A1T4RP61_9HYPH|nr:hypothetical protein [Enhydrobacter aerosaccus]SKA17795.1 hypothetical protein SAMN02745126_04007 [Enhydrobacter aerosaccus]
MADTQRGIAPGQRQEVNIPGVGLGPAPGVSARPVPVALPGVVNPDTSASQALLRALDIGAGNLDGFGKEYLKDSREEEFKLGQMKAQESQEKFADAQAKGIIPQGANPWFIKGYQNQDGRVTGMDDYYNQMQSAYLQSPAKSSDDPAVFQKFMQDFKKQYMATLPADRTADWWDGFRQSSGLADERMAREHANNITQAVIAKQETNTGAEINAILNTTGDPKVAAERINALGEKMRLEGMPDQSFANVAAQAIIAKAKGDGNASYLAALDNVKTGGPGSSATLASNPRVQDARVSTNRWLIDKARGDQEFAWAADNHRYQMEVVRPRAEAAFKHEQESWAHQSATWDRQTKGLSLLTQIQTATISDPASAYATTRPLLEKLAEVDPTAVSSATSFVASYINGTNEVAASAEAPVLADLRNQIISSAGNPLGQLEAMKSINDAVANKKINARSSNDLFAMAQHMASYDPSLVRKINSPEMNDLKSSVKSMLTKKENNPFGLLDAKGANDFMMMTDAINNSAMELLKKKPDATALELRAEAEKTINALMPTLVPSGNTNSLDELGRKAQSAASGNPGAKPEELSAVVGRISPADKSQIVREAAQAHAQGPQAFQQFITNLDQQLGRPGITAAIIEDANNPPATAKPKKK